MSVQTARPLTIAGRILWRGTQVDDWLVEPFNRSSFNFEKYAFWRVNILQSHPLRNTCALQSLQLSLLTTDNSWNSLYAPIYILTEMHNGASIEIKEIEVWGLWSTGPPYLIHILSAACLNCNWFFGNLTAAEDYFQPVPKYKLKVKLQRR